jgi:hypothetical protein
VGEIKLEFYDNGKIKSYRVRGFFLKFKDRISYDNEHGFMERELRWSKHEGDNIQG